MASGVKVRDKGYNALLKRLVKKKPTKVTVGIHEAEGSEAHGDGGASTAEVAEIHELGLGVDQRSFIAGWVDENEGEIEGQLRQLGEAVIKGTIASPEQAMERFGLHAVGGMQKRMAAGIEPELADSTVAAKGSSTPLIDSGQMRSAITHKVEQ
jgi:hypothetical protein